MAALPVSPDPGQSRKNSHPRLHWLALVSCFTAVLGACTGDDAKREHEKTSLELRNCEVEKTDLLNRNNTCLEELDLAVAGRVTSYHCSGSGLNTLLDTDGAQYSSTCLGESSVTVTEGSALVPLGMAIAFPEGSEPTFSTGGGVVFTGDGGVVFSGSGGVTFPGDGIASFTGGDESASISSSVGIEGELDAYDVYTITGKSSADSDPNNGFFVLPGGHTMFRCVQSGALYNKRTLTVAHDAVAGEYTFSCLDQSGNPASSTLISGM